MHWRATRRAALPAEPGMRGHLRQEIEERQPGEEQMLGSDWKIQLTNLGYIGISERKAT